jgi:hypothetical protein
MKRNLFTLFVSGLLALAPATEAASGVCSAHSDANVVPLVEVYTSEGCSSCVPAEHWVTAGFPARADPATAVVLAFHVDYWNGDGWRDSFSSHDYSDRQQRVAAANRSTFVFTPQVVVQGRNYQDWSAGTLPADLTRMRAEPAAADIALTVRRTAEGYVVDASAQVAARSQRAGKELFVALADSGHDVDVRGGENRGVRLHHDHVVRSLSDGVAIDRDGHARLSTRVPLPGDAGTAPTVVAFVQDPDRGTVLQTLALPVAACDSAP